MAGVEAGVAMVRDMGVTTDNGLTMGTLGALATGVSVIFRPRGGERTAMGKHLADVGRGRGQAHFGRC